jgi:hypothetical protein
MIGKMLSWLQERIKRWTKPVTRPLISGLMLSTSFMGENVSFPYVSIKKKKCKDIVILTDLGLHSSDMNYKIAGSYKDAR